MITLYGDVGFESKELQEKVDLVRKNNACFAALILAMWPKIVSVILSAKMRVVGCHIINFSMKLIHLALYSMGLCHLISSESRFLTQYYNFNEYKEAKTLACKVL